MTEDESRSDEMGGGSGGGSPKIPLAEIKKPSGLFASRLATEKVDIGGTVFAIQALPSTVRTWIIAARMNDAGVLQGSWINYDTVRFGVTAITNLFDQDNVEVKVTFESITVGSKPRQALQVHIMDGLPAVVLNYLAVKIHRLGELSEEDLKRLDFTAALAEIMGSDANVG